MTYYLTMKANFIENAKRHIAGKGKDLKGLEKVGHKLAKEYADTCIIEIYAGNWEHLETIH